MNTREHILQEAYRKGFEKGAQESSAGALLGGGVGALTGALLPRRSRRTKPDGNEAVRRLRNALIGAGIGATSGYVGGKLLGNHRDRAAIQALYANQGAGDRQLADVFTRLQREAVRAGDPDTRITEAYLRERYPDLLTRDRGPMGDAARKQHTERYSFDAGTGIPTVVSIPDVPSRLLGRGITAPIHVLRREDNPLDAMIPKRRTAFLPVDALEELRNVPDAYARLREQGAELPYYRQRDIQTWVSANEGVGEDVLSRALARYSAWQRARRERGTEERQ